MLEKLRNILSIVVIVVGGVFTFAMVYYKTDANAQAIVEVKSTQREEFKLLRDDIRRLNDKIDILMDNRRK